MYECTVKGTVSCFAGIIVWFLWNLEHNIHILNSTGDIYKHNLPKDNLSDHISHSVQSNRYAIPTPGHSISGYPNPSLTMDMASEQISGIIHYDRFALHKIRQSLSTKPAPSVLARLKELDILRYRGSRGGQTSLNRVWDTNKGVNLSNLQDLPQHIQVLSPTTQTKKCSNGIESRNLIKISSKTQNIAAAQKFLTICSLNTRSVKNKTLSLSDYISSNDFDLVALTETWLGSTVDKICIAELVPDGFKIMQVPRINRRGGGVALIYKSTLNVRLLASTRDKEFKNFEYMDTQISLRNFSVRLSIVYRPPPSKTNGFNTPEFLDYEWPLFLSRCTALDKSSVIVGDLNFHLDNPTDHNTQKFLTLLSHVICTNTYVTQRMSVDIF